MTGAAIRQSGTSTKSPEHHELVSPVTGRVVSRIRLADRPEIVAKLASLPHTPLRVDPGQIFAWSSRIREEIESRSTAICRILMMETGFVERDCQDTLKGVVEFLAGFEEHSRELADSGPLIPHSYTRESGRSMRIHYRPVRSVAALVPQNASLCLAVVVMASALRVGARAVIRPSLQCGISGEMLAEIVAASRPPEDSIIIINSLASQFLEACYASPDVELIHYIGSNQYAGSVLRNSFDSHKTCLIDGHGNGLLYVDASFPREEAIRIITTGVTRFNGETCTSVNGILVEPDIYESLRDDLVSAFRALRVGDPSETSTDIGPLFSTSQVDSVEAALCGLNRLCGGRLDGAYFSPALVGGVTPGHPLVTEGLFGPAAWIQPVADKAVLDWIRGNTFPLSDTILSHRFDRVCEFAAGARAARVCVNGDPTLESMFEPWGGYPPSGLNPVSLWLDKYRQAFQLDSVAGGGFEHGALLKAG